jgi:hypothetical protein
MRILLAAVVYFVAVMAAGVGCGVVRTLLIAPWTGPFAAVAAEAPFMILAMVVAARWVCRRFGLETRPMRIAAGLFAFLLTMVAESSGAIWLRGQTLDAYLSGLTTLEGLLSLALFILFGAMPALQGASGGFGALLTKRGGSS